MIFSWDSSKRIRVKIIKKGWSIVKSLWDLDRNRPPSLRKKNIIEDNIWPLEKLVEMDCWLPVNSWKTKEWRMKSLTRSWPITNVFNAKVSMNSILGQDTVPIIQPKVYSWIYSGQIQIISRTELRIRRDVLLLKMRHQSPTAKFQNWRDKRWRTWWPQQFA